MDMKRRLGAEAFGTFWLVFGGCGSAVLAAGVPDVGIGFAGVVSLASVMGPPVRQWHGTTSGVRSGPATG